MSGVLCRQSLYTTNSPPKPTIENALQHSNTPSNPPSSLTLKDDRAPLPRLASLPSPKRNLSPIHTLNPHPHALQKLPLWITILDFLIRLR